MALFRKQFEQAVRNYRKAILIVKATNAGATDVLLDLNLGLAETLRLQGNPSEAKKVLDESEPLIPAAETLDSMAPARYWRRRAELQKTMGDLSGAVSCYDKSFKLIQRNFPPKSRHFMSCWYQKTELLEQTLIGAKDQAARFSAANELLTHLKLAHDTWGAIEKIPSPSRERYAAAASHLAQYATEVVEKQNTDNSAKILHGLTDIDEHTDMATRWLLWTYLCIQQKKIEKLNLAANDVQRLLSWAKEDQDLLSEIQARCTLAMIYETTKEKSKASSEWSAMDAVLTKCLNSDEIDQEKVAAVMFWIAKVHRMFIDGADQNHNQEEYRRHLLLENRWTQFPPLKVAKGFDISHVANRCELALQYLNLMKFEAAADTIASIEPRYIPGVPETFMRLAEINLRLGNHFRQIGNSQKAAQHFREAKRYYYLVPVSYQKQQPNVFQFIGTSLAITTAGKGKTIPSGNTRGASEKNH